MIGIMVSSNDLMISLASSRLPVVSTISELSTLFLYKNKSMTRNISAAIAPASVPAVPPAAPYAAALFKSLKAFIRYAAATTLTTALNICSTIWLTAVGTMVRFPWKKPLITPIMEKTKMVGVSTLSGITQLG